MGYKSYLVYIELEHEGCWTKITRSRDLFVKNLWQDLSYDDDAYRSLSIFVGEDLRSFLNPFKSHKNILDIKIHSLSKNVAFIEYTRVKSGSITNLVKKLSGIIISLEATDGIEMWKLVLPRVKKKHVEILKKGVEAMGSVFKLHIAEPEPSDLVEPYPLLSRLEDKVLSQAYISGYFDYPRKVRAEDVARALGITRVTFLYHVRRAEKKLVANYLRKRSAIKSHN